MRITIIAVVTAACAFAAGSLTSAATGWKVVASGQGSSQYFASANADADMPKSAALAVRPTSSKSGTVKVSYYVSCDGGDHIVKSGTILEISAATAKSCSLSGNVTSEAGGIVRIDLLRR
jgi:hypothetical protein